MTDDMITCPQCNGTGTQTHRGVTKPITITCLRCNGTGRVPNPNKN